MTTPEVATVDVGGSRHYRVPGVEPLLPSVTSIIGALDKPALPRWAAIEAAKYAVENRAFLAQFSDEEQVKRIKGAPWSKSDKAANAGTDTHGVMERIAKREPITFIQAGTEHAVRSVAEFWLEFRPRPIMVERTVVNATIGYAGSFDLIAEIAGNGRTAMIDLKTGKNAYPDTALQLAAYGRAEFVADPDGSRAPMPAIDDYYVLHAPLVGPWGLIPYEITDADYHAFLGAKVAFDWKRDRTKAVMGRRMRLAAAK
jgi:hypothetical protein